MSAMTESYRRYLDRLDRESAEEFLDNAFEYDFSNYESDMAEMEEVHRGFRKPVEARQMKSNGSGQEESEYAFGPNCTHVVRGFEERQRRSRKRRVMLNCRFDFYQVERFAELGDSIFADLTCEKGAEYLLGRLEKRGDAVLEAFPNVVMMMGCHDTLAEYFAAGKARIFSSCWDAFYDKRRINALDRMVDWKTGVNFHECEHGGRHIVPIWSERGGRVTNLLNLTKASFKKSDIMEVRGFEPCGCGRTRCEYRFVPHYKQRPMIDGEYLSGHELITKIKSRMLNMQFIEAEPGVFHIYHDMFDHGEKNRLPEDDRAEINSFLKGREAKYMPYRSYLVGRYKYPTFWKGFDKSRVVDNICCII